METKDIHYENINMVSELEYKQWFLGRLEYILESSISELKSSKEQLIFAFSNKYVRNFERWRNTIVAPLIIFIASFILGTMSGFEELNIVKNNLIFLWQLLLLSTQLYRQLKLFALTMQTYRTANVVFLVIPSEVAAIV